MNILGIQLANKLEKSDKYNNIPTNDLDDIYAVADGLSEDYVMRAIECRGSIDFINKNTPEVLEKYLDNKIDILSKIRTKYFNI